MKRWRQLVSFYLALCMAMAGTVGISPALHVLVEHGGRGASHTHLGKSVAVHSHGGAMHSHEVPPPRAATAMRVERLVEPGGPLRLFGLQPRDIYRAIARLLVHAFDNGGQVPEQEAPYHTHHSLSQSLIAGAVEGAVTILPLVCAPERFVASAAIPEERAVAIEFYLSTAGRAPPHCC